MARELINDWGGYLTAVDRLLGIAGHQIQIYDQDIRSLKLESGNRLEQIKRVLLGGHRESLQIAVRDGDPLRLHHPRLLNLLGLHGHLASAMQSTESLANLRDGMLLIDEAHGLIRFDRDHARSKLLINEPDEIRPYLQRFREIWNEGGDPIRDTVVGL